jgi:hypothetical protein
MEDRGFELSQPNAGNSRVLPKGGAECGALFGDSTGRDVSVGCAPSGPSLLDGASLDADLAKVIERWPTLPDAVRASILAIIDAADL